ALDVGELVRVPAAGLGGDGGRGAVTEEAERIDESHAARIGSRIAEREGVEVDVVRSADRAHEGRDRLALLLRGDPEVGPGDAVQAAGEVLIDGAVREVGEPALAGSAVAAPTGPLGGRVLRVGRVQGADTL